MDTKGFEKKPWFPYVKNMYDEIEGDMMSVDAKGYEEKPWWPYVLDLQEKIDEGGGGGGGDLTIAKVTLIGTNNILDSMTIPFSQILHENAEMGTPNAVVSWSIILHPGDRKPDLEVPLFKGKYIIVGLGYKPTKITGAAEYDEHNAMLIITGDCEITW